MSHISPSSSSSSFSSTQEAQESEQSKQGTPTTLLGKRKIESTDPSSPLTKEAKTLSSQEHDINSPPSSFTTTQPGSDTTSSLQKLGTIEATVPQTQEKVINQKILNYRAQARELQDKAQSTNDHTSFLYQLISASYSSTLASLEKAPKTDSLATQLFEKSLFYLSIAKQEIEKGHYKIVPQMQYVSIALLQSAEAQLEGDTELATHYHHLATSHFYFAVAQEPRLVEYLPPEQRLGFHPNDIPQQKFIDYWAEAFRNRDRLIKEIIAHRASPAPSSEETTSLYL